MYDVIVLSLFGFSRVIAAGETKQIGVHVFKNWGSHSNAYPFTYMTAAAAVGITRNEIDIFIKRLDKIFAKFRNKYTRTDESLHSKSHE